MMSVPSRWAVDAHCIIDSSDLLGKTFKEVLAGGQVVIWREQCILGGAGWHAGAIGQAQHRHAQTCLLP